MRLLILGLALLLTACQPDDGSSQPDRGAWFQVRTPPHAPKRTECWVWQYSAGESALGGPYCFVPEKP